MPFTNTCPFVWTEYFKGHGWYKDEVTFQDGTGYQVLYEDEDRERHTEQSLAQIVLSSDLARVDIDTHVAVKWPNNSECMSGSISANARLDFWEKGRAF